MTDQNLRHSRRIMVEGPDDQHVVRRIMRRAKIRGDVDVTQEGGINGLIEAIDGAVPLRSSKKAIGIIADANASPSDRWKELCDPLRENNYKPPNKPRFFGTILTAQQRPRVGIWLMPNNRRQGEIEDFVAEMVPKGDKLWKYATTCVTNIPHKTFAPHRNTRVVMRVWLAMLKEPNFMGSAISRGALCINGRLCQRFCKWLEKLLQ